MCYVALAIFASSNDSNDDADTVRCMVSITGGYNVLVLVLLLLNRNRR